MTMKRFIAGVGIGFVAGYLLRPTFEKDILSPERALKEVKKTVSRSHTISGSWIHMLPETIEKQNILYDVYRGGLSTSTEEGTKQFEFLVDTKTGFLVEFKALA